MYNLLCVLAVVGCTARPGRLPVRLLANNAPCALDDCGGAPGGAGWFPGTDAGHADAESYAQRCRVALWVSELPNLVENGYGVQRLHRRPQYPVQGANILWRQRERYI